MFGGFSFFLNYIELGGCVCAFLSSKTIELSQSVSIKSCKLKWRFFCISKMAFNLNSILYTMNQLNSSKHKQNKLKQFNINLMHMLQSVSFYFAFNALYVSFYVLKFISDNIYFHSVLNSELIILSCIQCIHFTAKCKV